MAIVNALQDLLHTVATTDNEAVQFTVIHNSQQPTYHRLNVYNMLTYINYSRP